MIELFQSAYQWLMIEDRLFGVSVIVWSIAMFILVMVIVVKSSDDIGGGFK